ncbi:MAG: hypothetical protein ACTSPY_00345 [Candidatus Helarchaeota archaeon]
MKFRKYFLLLPIIILLISFIVTLYSNCSIKNLNKIEISSNDIPSFGIVEILNITLEKTEMQVGESIIINATYNLIVNTGWKIEHIYLGIKNTKRYLCQSLPKIQGLSINVSRKFFFEPEEINISLNYKGFMEIKLYNETEPSSYVVIIDETIDDLIFRKAFVEYELLEQDPEIIFSFDDTHMIFEFYNQNNNSFKYRNRLIAFDFVNYRENITLNYVFFTDNNGIIDEYINTSDLGCGQIFLYFYFNETEVYRANLFLIELNIYNETECFNFSILNKHSIYANFGINDSFSQINLSAYCSFNANISYTSTFSSGIFNKFGQNDYFCNIQAPENAGNYTINTSATPIKPGSQLMISRVLEVKKRPLMINFKYNRSKNYQSRINLFFLLTDNLTETVILNQNISIYYFNENLNNWSLIDIILVNRINMVYYWDLPFNFNSSKVLFKVIFENSSTFEPVILYKEFIINKIIPIIQPVYSLSSRIDLIFQVMFFNNTEIQGILLNIKIDNESWFLTTNKDGFINISLITPSIPTSIIIQVICNESEDILPLYLEFEIRIQRDVIQSIDYYSGYIIVFVIMTCLTVIVLKTYKRPKLLPKLKVE